MFAFECMMCPLRVFVPPERLLYNYKTHMCFEGKILPHALVGQGRKFSDGSD